MGKRRKPAGPKLADDPHGWLVGVLQGQLAHPDKAQRAVTALTGFESIAGSEQGAGSNRPFDHQASDDSIRLDTNTQQADVLDVKPGQGGVPGVAGEDPGRVPLSAGRKGEPDEGH